MQIVETLKAQSLLLSKQYNGKVKIEIDVNSKVGSSKVKVTEFLN